MTIFCLKPIQSQTDRVLLESLSVRGLNCVHRAAVVIKPVSADSLRKTGIFADKAGDFRRFPPQVRRTGGLETKSNARKAGISGALSRFSGSVAKRRNGWLRRRIRTVRWSIGISHVVTPIWSEREILSANHGEVAFC